MQIETAKIYASDRSRPLVKANVEQLALSIDVLGLLNPIIVKPSRRFHGGIERDVFDIVAGGHRFEAVRQLGWTEVTCKVIEHVDDLRVELAEIDENLVRSNLSPAQEASAISRRKELYELLHPSTRHGEYRGNQHEVVAYPATTRFTAATSEATGKAERSVQKAATRGKRLGDDLRQIEGTSLDRAEELDALGKMTPEERRPLIERAQAGEKVSARPFKLAAEPLNEVETKEKWMSRGMSWWNAGCQEWREEFRTRTDESIMDRRYA